MTHNRICLRAMLVMTAALAIGCYESASPLDPAPQVDIDARLLGAWRCVSGGSSDEAITVTVARSGARSYAVASKERDHEPDRYEGYASALNGSMVMNLRNLKGGAKPWSFLRVDILQPNVLFVHYLSDALLKNVAWTPAALRAQLERERLNPALYEDLCVCLRLNEEKK